MKGITKKLLTGLLILTSFFVSACATPADIPKDETDASGIQWNDTDEELVTTKGIATNITLSIGGGENSVWAKVKNNFTLLPSTIWVYVELYSSETYQESYTTMNLEKMDSVKDLDIGKSITISVPTGGMQKYWQARMRYKFDDRDWVAKTTSTFLYSAEGKVMDEHEEEIKKPTAIGSLYSLQQAYDNGFLTQENLQSIADYHNNGKVCHDTLDDTTVQLIKESAAYYERNKEKSPVLYAKAEDYEILKYYGVYNGCYVFILNHPYSGWLDVIVDEWVTIGGVKIHYTDFSDILIWKLNSEIEKPVAKGSFYTLQQAYDNGFLTQENLQSIADYHNGNNREQLELSEDTAQALKREWVKKYKEEHGSTNKTITASILEYYGTYNDCIVIIAEKAGTYYPDVYAPINIEVGGVIFTYKNSIVPQIVIFKIVQAQKEEIKKPVESGPFYSLQSAYDNGWLSQEQLLSIAYYHHSDEFSPDYSTKYNTELMGENYQPIPKSPETLSEDLKLSIMQSLRDFLYTETSKNVDLNNISIYAYYGTYNDVIAIKLRPSITIRPGLDPFTVLASDTVAGVKFNYFYPNSISFNDTDYTIDDKIKIWKLTNR